MNKVVIVVIAVVLAVAIAAGSFYGGMAYQQNQASATRNAFLRSRGINPNGTGGFQGGNGQNGAGRGFFGGGATGQVKSLNGNTLTISTAQNVTTVNLNNNTVVEKTAQGSTSDLQTGERVLVTGQRDSNGNITASQILILPATTQANAGATP